MKRKTDESSPMITIEKFSNQYTAGIIDLILTIQVDEFAIPITLEEQPDLLSIDEFYQNGKGNFWVALHSGNVVGTIALLDIGKAQVAFRKLFVHRDYRGRKYDTASQLLAHLLAWSKLMRVEEIYLGTTAKYLAAHKFYEKHHFQEIEKRMLPEDFPIMEVDTKFYTLRL
jgi:N-acetylglutamate synthase-like GNAT family acetyltransferase